MHRLSSAFVAISLGVASPAVAAAQSSDPASQQVDALDRALLSAMKEGKTTSVQDRYRKLTLAVQRAFDFGRMIRVAAGPAWTKASPSEQSALTAAFARFSAATYAHNFDSYSGQKFVIDRVDTRLPDKLVRTELTSPGGASVILSYRMQQAAGGGWKIVDVYFNGSISELAQQSSDFAATLAAGGAPALTKKLDDQTARLLRWS